MTDKARIKRMSQREKILAHLKSSPNGITSLEAIRLYKITRISAVIFALRKKGYNIVSMRKRNEETGTVFARYVLLKNKEYPMSIVHRFVLNLFS